MFICEDHYLSFCEGLGVDELEEYPDDTTGIKCNYCDNDARHHLPKDATMRRIKERAMEIWHITDPGVFSL